MKATGYGYGVPEGSKAKVVLHGMSTIEHADVYSAAIDVGQGAHSVLIQIAAHVLGIPFDLIEIHPGDTASSEDSGAAAASRLTYFAGNAVKLAAELALKSWRDENRPAVGDAHWISPPTTAPDPLTGACIDNVSYSYAAQGVIVEVDLETGQVILDTVIATHDPGRAINPQKVEGQIQGAVVQAMGWALLENFVTEQAMIKTNTLSTYLIPTTLDIPAKVKSIQIEKPDPVGPFGVRGVGEIPFIPLAPAVIAAIRDATGIWFNHLPIKPEEVVEKIKENNQA
jgi:CO/xanthine dehydrogenase Mo-binding subunit